MRVFRLARVQSGSRRRPTGGKPRRAHTHVIGDARGWDRGKRRDFQNDALIGLTAVRHGATVVTANHTDFELLTREIPLSLFPV